LGFESFSIISLLVGRFELYSMRDWPYLANLLEKTIRMREKIRVLELWKLSLYCNGLLHHYNIFIIRIIADNWLNLKHLILKECLFSEDHQCWCRVSIAAALLYGRFVRFRGTGESQYVPNGLGILRNGLVVLGLLFVPTLEMFFIWQTYRPYCLLCYLNLLNGILTSSIDLISVLK
jgi:hypothetical protein